MKSNLSFWFCIYSLLNSSSLPGFPDRVFLVFLFPLWLLLFRFPLLDPLTAWDSVPGHFPRAVTLASAGADLKEREQMSEAEVGLFVQRLRGLMTEIGEGSGVGRRRAFRGPADPSLTQSTIL